MFLLDWYKEWLDIRAKKNVVVQEEKVCASCETLKQQLEIANYERNKMLDRIMEKPKVEPERVVAPIPTSRPVVMPWRIRQQTMEREDRMKAAAMKNAAQPDIKSAAQPPVVDKELEELEKELDSATAARESQSN